MSVFVVADGMLLFLDHVGQKPGCDESIEELGGIYAFDLEHGPGDPGDSVPRHDKGFGGGSA